jgi:hypothetical protein
LKKRRYLTEMWGSIFNMAQTFTIPEGSPLVGLNLRQASNRVPLTPAVGPFAQLLGISETQPFTAGQTFTISPDPGRLGPGSGEMRFLQSGAFAPGTSPVQQQQQDFIEEQRGRLGEFTGRVQGIPDILRALEQELGIPGARETFAETGGAVRDIAGLIRGTPEVQRQATRGRGITEDVLARLIAQKTQELQPTAETATRAFEEAGAGLEGLLGAFGTRAANVIAPFEIEAGVFGDQMAQEFDLFKTQIGADLDRELEQMRQTGLTDRANITRATELAKIEATASEGQLKDLGDRVALISPFTGQEVASFKKGLAPRRGTTTTGGEAELGTLFDQTFNQSATVIPRQSATVAG